jgi:hypothetical protein
VFSSNGQSFAAVLTSGQLLEIEDRVTNLNCIKMMLYLFCQLVEMVDMEEEISCSLDS